MFKKIVLVLSTVLLVLLLTGCQTEEPMPETTMTDNPTIAPTDQPMATPTTEPLEAPSNIPTEDAEAPVV